MAQADPSFVPLVIPFTSVARADIALAGGKAANLGELTRAGFPVPSGFVVTTEAYARVTRTVGLEPILEELARLEPTRQERIGALAAAARAKIAAAPMPPEIASAIADAYTALGAGAVAVRSSATAEDLAFASFAGQQDTYLDIEGLEAMLDAVRRVWASLFTERAVVYRASSGIDPHGIKLAVVVQRMVRAKAAGVVFTANPLTGKRRQMLIDVHPGLGEAVVSGAVVPDHFAVDGASGRILEQRLRKAAGASEGSACLSSAEVKELAALASRVEAHYGAPQDIEFALDEGGAVQLLQSRPITTLFPLPEGAPDSERELRVYVSATADEGVVRPLTPMGLQALRLGVSAWADLLWDARPAEPRRGPRVLVTAAMRVYYDITGLLRSDLGRRVLERFLPSADEHTARLVRQLVGDPRLAPRKTAWLTVARGGPRGRRTSSSWTWPKWRRRSPVWISARVWRIGAPSTRASSRGSESLPCSCPMGPSLLPGRSSRKGASATSCGGRRPLPAGCAARRAFSSIRRLPASSPERSSWLHRLTRAGRRSS